MNVLIYSIEHFQNKYVDIHVMTEYCIKPVLLSLLCLHLHVKEEIRTASYTSGKRNNLLPKRANSHQLSLEKAGYND